MRPSTSHLIVSDHDVDKMTIFSCDMQTVVAVAMLARRFDFQLALGAPPVSNLLVVEKSTNVYES